MKKIRIMAVLAIICCLTSASGMAEELKIGVIDFKKIVVESSPGKLMANEIKAKGDEFQKKIQEEKNQIDEMKKNIERESLVLNDDKKQEKEREFRIKVNDFKKMQQDFTRQFKQLEIESLNKLQKQVYEVSDKIGKDKGYSLIIEQKTAGVIYSQEKLDITDLVIKELNLIASKSN